VLVNLIATIYYNANGIIIKKVDNSIVVAAKEPVKTVVQADQATQTELMQRAGVESQVAKPGSTQNGYTVTPSMSNNNLSDNQALVSAAVKKN